MARTLLLVFLQHGQQQELIKILEDRLEQQTKQINLLQGEIGCLKKQVDEYEKKRFCLEKFANDDKAIQFYTGFPNFRSLVAVYEYLEPKVPKLQYWRGERAVSNSKPYQENIKSKPGRKRHLTGIEEFFMILVRLKVGLFVQDLSDRLEISQGHFSKIFST